MVANTSKVLSNREYDALLKEKRAEAWKLCDPVVRGAFSTCPAHDSEFVECSKDKFLSVAWKCRAQNRAMYECLRQQCVSYHTCLLYTSPSPRDRG